MWNTKSFIIKQKHVFHLVIIKSYNHFSDQAKTYTTLRWKYQNFIFKDIFSLWLVLCQKYLNYSSSYIFCSNFRRSVLIYGIIHPGCFHIYRFSCKYSNNETRALCTVAQWMTYEYLYFGTLKVMTPLPKDSKCF